MLRAVVILRAMRLGGYPNVTPTILQGSRSLSKCIELSLPVVLGSGRGRAGVRGTEVL